jgi:hypothetical protein
VFDCLYSVQYVNWKPKWNTVCFATCRSELLRVTFFETELPGEELHLAVVNAANTRLLLKGSIPVSSLLPGLHYNLRLQLSEAAAVFVTLVLVKAPSAQYAMLRTAPIATGALAGSPKKGVSSQEQHQLLRAWFASCSVPISTLLEGQKMEETGHQSGVLFEVWAVWHCGSGSSNDWGGDPLHVEIPGSDTAAAALVLQHCTEEALGPGGMQAMPLQTVQGLDMQEELIPWPPEHEVRSMSSRRRCGSL